jgi:hypothetical protein
MVKGRGNETNPMAEENESVDENLLEMQWSVLEVEESNLELEIKLWYRERNKV